MSLFGDDPDESAPAAITNKSRNSLFDDEPSPAVGSKSSLFADDDNSPGGSPWAMPTPKKASRGELIKTLLPASDVPDSYIDTFDNVMNSGDGSGGKINSSGVSKVLSAGSLSADDQTKIMNLVAPGGQEPSLGRNEFNVLLALIGLAQEHEDVTLDGIDERRRNLPKPNLPSLSTTKAVFPSAAELASKPAQKPITPPQPQVISPPKPRTMPKDIIEDDPWGSPALHKGHNHTTSNGNSGATSNGVPEPVRTTSAFTTNSVEGSLNNSTGQLPDRPTTSGQWGSYDGNAPTQQYTPTLGPEGDRFGGGDGSDDRPEIPITPARALGVVGSRGLESKRLSRSHCYLRKRACFCFSIIITKLPVHEEAARLLGGTATSFGCWTVCRSVTPFDNYLCFPPKRVGVNGSHLAADNLFIERRRRGLVRFSNALARHPVLNQEQLVIMFLTVPTELSVWRKQATISVQEEFDGRTLPPGLEDSLSPNLNDLFDASRTGVRRSAEIYINLSNLIDRLSKRNEGLAADHLRIANSLRSLIEVSQDTYATDTNEVPLLNEGLNSTAKHLSTSQSLLEDEARGWELGVLEDVKRQRDALVSMRELFDRRDRYDRDNIPQLERRIAASETKLLALRQKPEELVKPGEIEKVTESIIKDKESIVAQHARGVFIKECIRDELIFFQTTQFHVSRLSQDWAQERVKYSELQADNWKQLHEELESMPIGE